MNKSSSSGCIDRRTVLSSLWILCYCKFPPQHGMEHRGELGQRLVEGVTQSSPKAGPPFAVAVQGLLEKLDGEVSKVGMTCMKLGH